MSTPKKTDLTEFNDPVERILENAGIESEELTESPESEQTISEQLVDAGNDEADLEQRLAGVEKRVWRYQRSGQGLLAYVTGDRLLRHG